MTCHELDERLDDYVDGVLPDAERHSVEEHLASCADCRAAERRTRELLAHAASLPRSLRPSRDLWPGIEARLAAGRGWGGLSSWSGALGLAVAAALIVALASAVFFRTAPARVQSASIPGARLEPASDTTGEDPALLAAERDYEAAANALLEALQERRGRLPVEDLQRVRENLQVIDRALAEVRQAIAKDPASPELNRMLVSTHKKKVDVLRRVVRLSTAL